MSKDDQIRAGIRRWLEQHPDYVARYVESMRHPHEQSDSRGLCNEIRREMQMDVWLSREPAYIEQWFLVYILVTLRKMLRVDSMQWVAWMNSGKPHPGMEVEK